MNDDGTSPRLAKRHSGAGNDKLHCMRPSSRVGEISKIKRRLIGGRIENSICHRILLIVSHSTRCRRRRHMDIEHPGTRSTRAALATRALGGQPMGQRRRDGRRDGLPPTPEPVSRAGKSMRPSYGNHLGQKVIIAQRGRQTTTLPLRLLGRASR